MGRPGRAAVTQACPSCGRQHDTSVYVSGQHILCACGIRFEVKRIDVQPSTVNARGEPINPELAVTVASHRPQPAQQPLHEGDKLTAVMKHPEVPGYELVELLGKGGMGEVWRAKQLSLGRMVALKLLPAKFAKDAEFVARFEKEANALAALSHPGIVQIIDRGQAGDHYYFTMELVSGINLREMLGSGRLPLRDALRIGTQVARAIEYLHDRSIVHRDLKPENVLVDARGHIKIADFGLAGMKGNERDIALTATAVAMGTVNYMAPEQRRDAKNVDHRADLYSLGVLVYELLTGELPIGRFKVPSAHVPDLDTAVDEVVCQLLESDPGARPGDAKQLAAVLEAVTPPAAGVTTSRPKLATNLAAPPGTSQLLPPRSRPWKAGVAVLGALALLGVTLKFLPGEGEAAAARAPAWYHDSDGVVVYSKRSTTEGGLRLDFTEEEGGERLNLRCGQWSMTDGVLSAVQDGDASSTDVLRPRAYVAERYYLSDGLELSVDLQVEPLPSEFPVVDYRSQQHFAEVAFRIRDTVLSVYAIPQDRAGMRLVWHYFDRAGREESGSSVEKVDALQKDPMRVPQGRFQVRLKLTPQPGGDVLAEAWANNRNFARELLPGFGGKVGKIALGCRNHACSFDNLIIKGAETTQPP